jgi:RNA polymerase sigma-70 factor (ECF subfamily)
VLEYLDGQVHHISQGRGDTWDQKIAALKECIEALPADQKQAIDLRYLDNESAKSIAQRLRVSHEAIKKRLQRARGQLLNCLRRKKVLPETGP